MAVSEQIIQVLDKLCEKIGFVIDWSATNVLPQIQILCEKYINWEISTSIFWMIFGVIMLIISIIGMIVEANTDWTDGFSLLILIPILLISIIIMRLLVNMFCRMTRKNILNIIPK